MRSIVLLLSAAAVAAIVSACSSSSSFSQPDTAGNSAELHLVASAQGISATSWIDAYSTETCEDRAGEGRLASFSLVTRDERTARVPTGARLYFLAGAFIEPPVGASNVGKTSCRGMVSFVPETGHTYEVNHDLMSRNCPVTVKDLATGAEVPTAQKHRVTGSCRDKK